jgi:UDP-sulfoquinovose synthase
MKICILGGDGFCGWPTALHLSNLGHEVVIVDNLSRRKIDIELEVESLTPIVPILKRIEIWKNVSDKVIKFHHIDLSKDYEKFLNLICDERFDSIVHFAEQRAAPYSMKGSWGKRYTVNNNLNATNNVLCAIVESGLDIHLVHLGTMGVYGYGSVGRQIPEGYLKINIKSDDGSYTEQEIMYPPNPGSIYHLTKTQDALSFAFFNKNDDLRITDLHQGIVWGTHTQETRLDLGLINRFDYDGDYGTVLNRFLMQAAIKYPLTVYGTGGQTRAFIHIQDTVKCIELAIKNPPKKKDRVLIMNQMTETHRVSDLANLVSKMTDTKVDNLPNPRKEDSANDLNVDNKCFIDMGLKPTTLEEGLLLEVKDIAEKFKSRCDLSKITPKSYWTSNERDLNQIK